jgi:hypothetical protein
MKKFIYTLVLALILNSAFLIQNSNAQWQTEVRLTNDPGISQLGYNNSKQISVVGNTVHVVWVDHRNAKPEIYYKRSPDKGVSWGNDIRLVYSSGLSFAPAISCSDSIVYVAWQDSRFGNEEIMIKRSTNGGLNWSNDMRVTNDAASSRTPSIFAHKTIYEAVYLVWEDTRDGNSEIYYTQSSDGGMVFGAQLRVTSNSSSSVLPSVSGSDYTANIAWQEDRDGNAEIYYRRNNNGNWSAEIRLTNNGSDSQSPCIIRNNDFIGVVWYDNRDGNNEIYLKTSTNAGTNWSSDKRLTTQSSGSARPSMDISGQNIHIAWEDYRDGHSEAYYKSSPDQGLSWTIDNRLTNTVGDGSGSPSIFVSGTGVYLIWNFNNEIYFKKNPTGNPIGIQTISTEVPDKFSLGQNYPNPFNPTTKIRFDIPNSVSSPHVLGGDLVQLKVFDINGREVATLVNEQLAPGTYETTFDGSNINSGIYFYRLETNNIRITRKCILLK